MVRCLVGWCFGWAKLVWEFFLSRLDDILLGLCDSASISGSSKKVVALFGSETLVGWSRGSYFLKFFVNYLNNLLWLDASALCSFFYSVVNYFGAKILR